MDAHLAQAFLTGIWVAILSSAPIGPINFALVQTVLTRGKRPALMIALGGMIADAIYCFLGIALFGWIAGENSPSIFKYLNLLSIPVLIIMGINMIRKRNEIIDKQNSGRSGSGILLGTMLGISNPMLFGYWLWIASVVHQEGWVRSTTTEYVAFTTGVAIGIFGAFFGFIQLVALGNRRATDGFRKFFSVAVGVGFIVFGTILAIRFAILNWI